MKKDKTGRYNKIQRRKSPTLQKCYPSSPFGTDFFSLHGPARVEIQWKETSTE